MSGDLENWACAELDSLGLPDASVIIQYLQPLENPRAVKDYLSSMLDMSQPTHRAFVDKFLERQANSKVDKRFYRKSEISDGDTLLLQGKKKGKDTKNGSQGNSQSTGGPVKERKPNKKVNSSDKENRSDAENIKRSSPPTVTNVPHQNQGKKKGNVTKEVSPPALAKPKSTESVPASITQSKKKSKFVNLYSEGENSDVILLSGRNKCECLASKHKLINNCLSCGRIVCEQEGSGPCLFCGNFVQSKDEREGVVCLPNPVPEKQTKSKPVSVKDIAADIQKAVAHKNMLLEFDRTSEKRTRVFDDESDYFSSNSRWHSKSDREILQAKEKELLTKKYDRSNMKVNIDLLGRKIVVDETNNAGVYDPDDPVVKAILEREPDDIFAAYERDNEPPPLVLMRPVYTDTSSKNRDRPFPSRGGGHQLSRVQDRELQEMTDQGRCLSMHQPWASLLVAGIKLHEGRTWYSSHRCGRLC